MNIVSWNSILNLNSWFNCKGSGINIEESSFDCSVKQNYFGCWLKIISLSLMTCSKEEYI